MNPRLYVGNLSPEVTESTLRLLFSRVGPVAEVILTLDPTTQQSRGCGFVTMATPELAATALRDLHCFSLGGRYITVTEARPPQAPKGMMSEGFDHGPSAPFRPSPPPHKTHRRPAGAPRRRFRGR